jgi:hypothetical protein
MRFENPGLPLKPHTGTRGRPLVTTGYGGPVNANGIGEAAYGRMEDFPATFATTSTVTSDQSTGSPVVIFATARSIHNEDCYGVSGA